MTSTMKALICKNTLKSCTIGIPNNNLQCCQKARADCMFTRGIAKNIRIPSKRVVEPLKHGMKVCVIGAAGNVGSKISILLKLSPLVKSLSLYDIKSEIKGFAEDASHITSNCKVDVYNGRNTLTQALTGAKLVVICASEERTPGTNVCDLFEPNAAITYDLAKACAKTCPKATVVLVSQPVESLLPLIGEVYKEHHVYESRKLIGATSTNIMRSITLMAQCLKCSPFDIVVPVIGGHSSKTIVPVFSRTYPDPITHQAKPEKRAFVKKMLLPYTEKDPSELVLASIHDMNLIVKNSEELIFAAGKGQEAAVVAGATSAAGTALKIIQGMNMEENIHDYAYVKTDAVPGLTYSTTLVKYGPRGVVPGRPTRVNSSLEKELLLEAIEELRALIDKGEQYVRKRQ